LLGGLKLGNLVGHAGTLALQDDGRNETLDLGGLALGLLSFLLGGNLTTDDVLADIILLAQVKKLADLAGTLRSQTTGNSGVGETRKRGLASLGNDKGEGRKVGSDNASTDRLALALTITAFAETLVSLSEEQTNTLVRQNTLHHGETLLVVSSRHLKDVALPFVTEKVGLNFLGNALVVEDAPTRSIFVLAVELQLALVNDFNELLATGGRVSNVELNTKLAPAKTGWDGWTESPWEERWTRILTFLGTRRGSPWTNS
jgi:hypothetical protein